MILDDFYLVENASLNGSQIVPIYLVNKYAWSYDIFLPRPFLIEPDIFYQLIYGYWIYNNWCYFKNYKDLCLKSSYSYNKENSSTYLLERSISQTQKKLTLSRYCTYNIKKKYLVKESRWR